MKILFADDMIDVLQLYRVALEDEGHTVKTASYARAAIAAVKAERFDIIVMDVEMPGMNGWEAIRQIRQLPNGGDVPIVVYTAYYTVQDMTLAHEAGAQHLFTKPLMPFELNQRLEGIYAAWCDEQRRREADQEESR